MEERWSREWLITNGIGGYASSTVSGANTRHYHGLLIASLDPPTERMVMVAKIEERVWFNNQYFDLSTNQYPNSVYPNGTEYLKSFAQKPLFNWEYAADDWQLKKSICMAKGSNTTFVTYTNTGDTALTLEVHPLYDYSDYHGVFYEDPSFDFYTQFAADHLKIYPRCGSHPIFTKWSAGEYKEARSWYKNIQLSKSKARGLKYVCDYYRIGFLTRELEPKQHLTILFSTEEDSLQKNIESEWRSQSRRASSGASKFSSQFYTDLLNSGEQFLVKRYSTKSETIMAGYHWFTDWGRDTMISMRGLTIATGRKAISKSILSTFYKSLNQGMLPVRFPDNGSTIQYNNIDATLWLFIATYDYYNKFDDIAFIQNNFKALGEIVDWHIKGTRFNIHVTEEGFLYGGQEGEQLTWMDAIVDGEVITPRIGCPVEVNALWYNTLKIYEFFCKKLKSPFGRKYLDIITKFENNFPKYFINPVGTLYDVIIPNVSVDNSFRPNQIFWISLPFTVLDKEMQIQIFEAIKEKLYTPYGLRTLNLENPNFEAVYAGDQLQRDHSYHQGTVWPFLLYHYYHSFFKIYGNTKKNRLQVKLALNDLKEHFYNREGLHCISEIFDGQNPYEGKGCIQQAWSVAALIKLYTDYKFYELDEF
ncbi:amylo-alpha-1,6-glucosidase [Maribacter sp. X9]|uniref:amylo-alpha-1,6-glucosidase n=1 Tax=Maribacter sp. X9 TaxID=3402159 RepID=UPI003AF33997